MSKYTTEVRYICEMNSGFTVDEMSSHTPDEIIANSREKIFNFSYPIYESDHKPELETKILKHYYRREIGAETVALWKLWLNERLNLIMPKYNQLYATEAEIRDKMLYNLDIVKNSQRTDDFTRNGNQSGTVNTNQLNNMSGDHRDSYSDTPQGTISNVDNNTYLTDYRHLTDTESETESQNTQQTTTNAETNAGTQTYQESETGYNGARAYYEILEDFQNRIINIDKMVVEELQDLFILLW